MGTSKKIGFTKGGYTKIKNGINYMIDRAKTEKNPKDNSGINRAKIRTLMQEAFGDQGAKFFKDKLNDRIEKWNYITFPNAVKQVCDERKEVLKKRYDAYVEANGNGSGDNSGNEDSLDNWDLIN